MNTPKNSNFQYSMFHSVFNSYPVTHRDTVRLRVRVSFRYCSFIGSREHKELLTACNNWVSKKAGCGGVCFAFPTYFIVYLTSQWIDCFASPPLQPMDHAATIGFGGPVSFWGVFSMQVIRFVWVLGWHPYHSYHYTPQASKGLFESL